MRMANESSGHTTHGTRYGDEAANAYIQTTHHSDRQRFLSGYIEELLSDIKGARVIDIGAGTGVWSIYALKHGASHAVSIDYQQDMVAIAILSVSSEKLTDRITVKQGDAAHLDEDSGAFTLALSVQVGCNLPNTAAGTTIGFSPHFTEITRVLEKGGSAIITAPDSFGTVFAGGTRTQNEILAEIERTLAIINHSEVPTPARIQEHLKTLSDVYLASFVIREKQLVLVTDEHILTSGEEIWRKLPGLVVPNFYHSVLQYEEEFAKNNLKIITKFDSGFASDDERKQYNTHIPSESRLGISYTKHAPFAVWKLVKE